MNELKDKRILIVEDNPTNIAVYSAILRRSGAAVIMDMWNTNTVRFLLESLPIDIILLDLMLRNNVSGYDIFDKLKLIPSLASIPIVAVSAADPTIEIPKAQAKGFVGFIGKPVSPRLFPMQIVACINREPVWYSTLGHLENYLP